MEARKGLRPVEFMVKEASTESGPDLPGDADLTDQQMMAVDGHKSRDVLPIYVAAGTNSALMPSKKDGL